MMSWPQFNRSLYKNCGRPWGHYTLWFKWNAEEAHRGVDGRRGHWCNHFQSSWWMFYCCKLHTYLSRSICIEIWTFEHLPGSIGCSVGNISTSTFGQGNDQHLVWNWCHLCLDTTKQYFNCDYMAQLTIFWQKADKCNSSFESGLILAATMQVLFPTPLLTSKLPRLQWR